MACTVVLATHQQTNAMTVSVHEMNTVEKEWKRADVQPRTLWSRGTDELKGRKRAQRRVRGGRRGAHYGSATRKGSRGIVRNRCALLFAAEALVEAVVPHSRCRAIPQRFDPTFLLCTWIDHISVQIFPHKIAFPMVSCAA